MPLHADSTRLTQVFVNLLNNAAKYMEKSGQIWLGVKVLPAPAGKGTPSFRSPSMRGAASLSPSVPPEQERGGAKEVVVRIKDNGVGISADFLPHIFDAFTQADVTSERSKSGLGIGLTLARHLVDLHGGSIEAESEGLGEGSEFIVRLPLAELCAEVHAGGQPAPAAVPEIPPFKRVLVVDDVRLQAQSMGMLLELMGFEVRMAHNGRAALTILQEFFPDVALIDIGLPGMNGYEVAQQIRALPQLKDIVVIAQTGWGRDTDREQARQAGSIII
jgi:CheY-like chemotaxis protein